MNSVVDRVVDVHIPGRRDRETRVPPQLPACCCPHSLVCSSACRSPSGGVCIGHPPAKRATENWGSPRAGGPNGRQTTATMTAPIPRAVEPAPSCLRSASVPVPQRSRAFAAGACRGRLSRSLMICLPLYRAPMRARGLDVPPGAGADHCLARGLVGIGQAPGPVGGRSYTDSPPSRTESSSGLAAAPGGTDSGASPVRCART